MCYSAMIESQFARYVRETGAEIDREQFEEVFGWRCREPGLRILRAVERWFDDPQTDSDHRIAALIKRHNGAQIAKLETAVFAQRKRLADAERKLALKPTKGAANERRIATTKVDKALHDLGYLRSNKASPLDARAFSMRYAPIVVQVNGCNLIRLARYHLRRPGDAASEDVQKPGLYNARRDNLERYWRNQFGHTHAIMLMWSFYEWVECEGGRMELQFRPQDRQLMRVACLYAEWQGEDGQIMPCFAAITDQPPPEVAAAGHDRCPINLTAAAALQWLDPKQHSHDELQRLLDEREYPYYEHHIQAA